LRYYFDPEAVAQSLAVVPAPNVAFFAFAGVYDAIKASVLQPAVVYKLGGQNAMITPIKLLSIAAHTLLHASAKEFDCE